MKKKGKISHVKRSNQLNTKLRKQGKLKKQRHKRKLRLPKQISQDATGSDYEDTPIDMDKDDGYNDVRQTLKKMNYPFLSKGRLSIPDPLIKGSKVKRKAQSNDEALERKYEEDSHQPLAKKQKVLLPIKTAEGLVPRTEELSDSDLDEEKETDKAPITKKEDEASSFFKKFAGNGDFSAAQLLASRQATLQKKRFRIGLLSAGLLEAPETKIANFKELLDFLEEKDPQVRISVRKLALVSLVEVFKDLLPAYQIKHQGDSKVKLKKDVKHLHEYENSLLKAYKTFLQKIEKIIAIFRPKKGEKRIQNEVELKLAELTLQSLCDLLKEHPYFNYAQNIVHLLVPLLNCSKVNARGIVASCLGSIIKSDKRGEISLEIVRSINKLVKSKNDNVQPAALEVLLSLKLKDINLDAEKEAGIKEKKLNSKKQNILRLSKRERKREKRLKELNQELLETKASENQQSKHHHLTEITKLVFAMYFRILKGSPSSRLMKAALEGVAKFAHCINVDFYHDLINVLGTLIDSNALGYKEQLCCVQTVFTILTYHGASINIDPVRFYRQFYSQLLQKCPAHSNGDLAMILSAAEGIVIKRRKQLTLQRLLAFTKRLVTLSSQVLPNSGLALLSLVRQVFQASKATNVLLDTDSTYGHGVYQPELEEPEYCNAGATALWELLALKRHYHPTMREYAGYLSTLSDASKEASASGKPFVKLTSEELFKDYDPSEMKFVPAVPPPSSIQGKKKRPSKITNESLKKYIKETLSTIKTS